MNIDIDEVELVDLKYKEEVSLVGKVQVERKISKGMIKTMMA